MRWGSVGTAASWFSRCTCLARLIAPRTSLSASTNLFANHVFESEKRERKDRQTAGRTDTQREGGREGERQIQKQTQTQTQTRHRHRHTSGRQQRGRQTRHQEAGVAAASSDVSLPDTLTSQLSTLLKCILFHPPLTDLPNRPPFLPFSSIPSQPCMRVGQYQESQPASRRPSSLL
jgi:hypothetical protein